MSEINLQETLARLTLGKYTTSSILDNSSISSQSFQSYFDNYKTNYSNNSINNLTSSQSITYNSKQFKNTTSSSNDKVTYKNNKEVSNTLEQEQINNKYNSSKDETTEEVSENANEITEDVNEASENVIEITEDVIEISENVIEITEGVNEISENVIEITEGVNKISENVIEITEGVNETTEDVIEQVEEFNEFVEDLKSKVNENLVTVLVYDPRLVSQISEVLQVSSEDIVSTLSEMNLTISDLSQQENLISFMQEVLELENPEMLISIDDIKEQMYEISQVSTNVSYSEVIQTTSENVTDTLEELQELQELLTVPVNNLTKTEDVDTLLEKLSGEIIEVEGNTYTSTPQNLDNNSQNNSNFFNQNFNSGQFSMEQNLSQLVDVSDENFNLISQGIDSTFNYSNSLSSMSSISQKNVLQRNLNSLDVINQIMDKMKNSIKTDTSEIKLLLRPDSLGEVSLKISTQNGIIAAQFTAENQKVKEIIESNFSMLKDMLNEKGIEVSQLDVSINDENNSNSSSFEQFAFNQEKSEDRVKNIIDKVLQEEQEVTEYVEDNELISSNVNYSV